MINYLLLMYEFIKVGLFSVGGGYATLPFLYHIAEVYNWYSAKELVDMLAVSSITPGPVGINVATFAGFKTGGLLGALIATASVMLPSYLLVIVIYKLLNRFNENFYVQAVLYAVKPAGCALIAAVAVRLFRDYILRNVDVFNIYDITAFVDIKALLLLVGLFVMSIKIKKDPLVYLGVAALFGIILHLNFS